MAMIWEGKNAISSGRRVLGEANPEKAVKGTIRGDFGLDILRNVCHGSDSQESAER